MVFSQLKWDMFIYTSIQEYTLQYASSFRYNYFKQKDKSFLAFC